MTVVTHETAWRGATYVSLGVQAIQWSMCDLFVETACEVSTATPEIFCIYPNPTLLVLRQCWRLCQAQTTQTDRVHITFRKSGLKPFSLVYHTTSSSAYAPQNHLQNHSMHAGFRYTVLTAAALESAKLPKFGHSLRLKPEPPWLAVKTCPAVHIPAVLM